MRRMWRGRVWRRGWGLVRTETPVADLTELETKALAELNATADEAGLQAWNTKYFGDKGELTAALKALGTLPKGAWAAIIGVCLALTVLTLGRLLIISMIGVAAALIYLLDVRPGLKDLTDGKGFW